ncbi:Panacea domain-containing protein [Alkalibacillus haloalkaliphilus]|uniref:Panacea domain-containing protein n=1 Tax=Alkalibacillus haloalkaliphilus TaxID=94136 RepID=UPI00030716BC|nr:type II toxin-antitoxin system antitoxin SocA domain-containing protein [Alkalibacillus haloalkaliphilus]
MMNQEVTQTFCASEIAAYFIHKSTPNTENSITNLKLQKILYYAQGFHRALTGENLFHDKVEAWVHGPVVPTVYRNYKKYNFRDIIPENSPEPTQLDDNVENFLNEIWDLFKDYSGKDLEKKTHKESPWLNARNGLPDFVYSNTEISVEDIASYFRDNYIVD